jgi:hypothetical protein
MRRLNTTNMKCKFITHLATTKSRGNITVQENKNEYIENLKRQIGLLEGDIYSIKDRELQLEKAGGFCMII